MAVVSAGGGAASVAHHGLSALHNLAFQFDLLRAGRRLFSGGRFLPDRPQEAFGFGAPRRVLNLTDPLCNPRIPRHFSGWREGGGL